MAASVFDPDIFAPEVFDTGADASTGGDSPEIWIPRTIEAEAWTAISNALSVFSRVTFSLDRYLGKRVFSMNDINTERWTARSKQAETWT